jgi:hypothetical protein
LRSKPNEKDIPCFANENEGYKVSLLENAAVKIAAGSTNVGRFEPHFTILRSEVGIRLSSDRISHPYYRVIAWEKAGSDERIRDLFKAADIMTIQASASKLADRQIRWLFPDNAHFSLEAWLTLPAGKGEPQVHFSFTPRKAGSYSIGYTGAPEVPLARADSIWQPLMWGDKRLPDESYLTAEARCSIPMTTVTCEGRTFGVLADPAKLPYRMPNDRNNLFGVAVRNVRGNPQPMVFAPILAGMGSKMQPGQPFDFDLLLFVHGGDFSESFEYVARNICQFTDYRQNTVCSLNTTLENMIEFAMGPYGRFDETYKGSAYDQDMAGSVKNVSPLHPLGVALVTDNEEIFERRAKPIVEYVLSREKFLFMATGEKGGQLASNKMTGPCAPVSELVSLYRISKGRSPVFLHHVKSLYDVDRTLNMAWVTEGSTWKRSLALYRATGDRKYLDDSARKADRYIDERVNQPQNDFDEAGTGTFWDYMLPAWKDLFELYEETRNDRYLVAAVKGAHQYASLIWFYPVIPDEYILVNKGGLAPTRSYRNAPPIHVPEEMVKAWRVSDVGLLCEGNGTAARLGIFLATHAPYFLRLAHYADDDFLRDIGRSAVVGRYANFPGYHMNTEYTTVYEKPDFPFRPLEAFTITSLHYNHIWPQIALVLDYLVADAFERSDGNIDFPSQYAEGYCYLHGRVYGDRPGKFYGEDDVWLWMPPKLLYIDNTQVNYVAGRGNGNLYLTLMNQGDKDIEVNILLNDRVIPVDKRKSYRVLVLEDNKLAEPTGLQQGAAKVSVSKKGITALVIKGLRAAPKFQSKILASQHERISGKSHKTVETTFGGVHGMILSFGDMAWFYGYLEAGPEQLKQATLSYSSGIGWQKMADREFPFEFTIPLDKTMTDFRFCIEVVKRNDKLERSDTVELKVFEE